MRFFLWICVQLWLVSAVDRSKFRTCAQTRFCKRHRQPGALKLHPTRFTDLRLLDHAVEGVRVRVEETAVESERWEASDILTPDTMQVATYRVETSDSLGLTLSCAESAERITVQFDPLRIDVTTADGEQLITLNSQGLLHFEHRHAVEAPKSDTSSSSDTASSVGDETREIVDWGEDGKPIYADDEGGSAEDAVAEEPAPTPSPTDDRDAPESFGGHTDTKPNGATSVGLDIAFPNSNHVYGIPEHATRMALKHTDGSSSDAYSEPYRLYNLDVFEYELDEPMALYGAIPFMVSHTKSATVGVFWNNPSETFVDVSAESNNGGKVSHWISESGVVDVFLLLGPSPAQVFSQYSAFTGTTTLPPLFAIAYHQCRWNYRDERDVFEVDSKFEEYDFPYDVLWLDIEHTDGKRYFTWDKTKFPNPGEMQRKLASRGRKMVTIVDPHIKRDSGYEVHKGATDERHYVQDNQGKDFDGWCWPGSSSYVDFTSAKVRSWWSDRFAFDKYVGSTESLYTWNDMNEPSVFNGPEVSMRKDMLSTEGVEHREWHNLYGFYQHMATAEGLVRRNPDRSERPFVLSRAFFAGSQRHGAIWTGDNAAQWSHLQVAVPMLLTQNIAGLPFSGADVGGFFGNPDAELMIRWYQAGSFQPFFRAHAHIDTKRREPWLFGDEVLAQLRDIVRGRYSLLPFWYTLFEESSRTGMPIMRPLWVHYPDDERTFSLDDAWLVGKDLYVKPVTTQGATEVSVYFPGSADELWYDVVTHDMIRGSSTETVVAPLDKIPVYQRGGSILPKKMRLRRCSSLMAADPFTLVVALDAKGSARGELYLDDEHTHNYRTKEESSRRSFEFKDKVLSGNAVSGLGKYLPSNTVERIIIVGLHSAPASVEVTVKGGTSSAGFAYDQSARVLTIRKPSILIAEDFTVTLK